MSARFPLLALLAAAALVSGCGSSSSGSSASASGSTSTTSTSTTSTASTSTTAGLTSEPSPGTTGFEGVSIEGGTDLARAGTTGTRTVDGIKCGATEVLTYHIHSHLTVYVNGQPRAVPGGIGIPGSQTETSTKGPVAVGGQCIYWLHTHAPDGIIHIESPTRRLYTLGDFFGVWRQPLSSDQVAGATGTVTAIVDGKPWRKDPRAIPLLPHSVIQLSVGQPVPPFHGMSWSGLAL